MLGGDAAAAAATAAAAAAADQHASGRHPLEADHQAAAEGAVGRLLVLAGQVAGALQAQLVVTGSKGLLIMLVVLLFPKPFCPAEQLKKVLPVAEIFLGPS